MKTAPRIARWILSITNRKENRETVLGDFEEIYAEIQTDRGTFVANIWFYNQAIISIPKFLLTTIYWNTFMLKNYFKIAWANLKKQKTYSLITMAGMAVGVGVFLYTFNLYYQAKQMDSFHKDIDKIHLITQVLKIGNGDEVHRAFVPYQLAPSLKNETPEIEDFTRVFASDPIAVRHGEVSLYENNVLFVDPNFLSFFTFKFISGDSNTSLLSLNTVVLTKSTAEKYFGDESPIGKELIIAKDKIVTVTGILEDPLDGEYRSSINFSILGSIETAQSIYGSLDDWKINNMTGFVKLSNKTTVQHVDEKINSLRNKYFDNSPDSPVNLYLLPLQGASFDAPYVSKIVGGSSFIAYIVLFVLGLLFLAVVIINYINLATAKYFDRLKEINIRKVVGAGKAQLIAQFISEAVLTSLISIPFSIVVFQYLQNKFYFVYFSTRSPLWHNIPVLVVLLVITVLIGVFTGWISSAFITSPKNINIMKNKMAGSKGFSRTRKVMVVFQFAVSVALILLTIVWQQQSDFLLNKADLGYNRSDIICVKLSGINKNTVTLLKEQLEKFPEVKNLAASVWLPVTWGSRATALPEGSSEKNSLRVYNYGVDYNFIETLNIKLLAGRSFSKAYNDSNNFVINKMMADRLGGSNIIGKSLTVDSTSGVIVGVADNYIFQNTFFALGPSIMRIAKNDLNFLIIKTSAHSNIADATKKIKTLWGSLTPDIPFDSLTLDEYFNDRYYGNTVFATELIKLFGIIVALFSSMGLLALASYSVKKRVKEIGIRKVVGASTQSIFGMIILEFLKLVIIANVIALPLAYIGSKALVEFTSSITTPIQIDVLIYTVVITMLIALVSVSFQTIKAANANPADSLKCE